MYHYRLFVFENMFLLVYRFHRSAGLPEMGYINIKKATEARGYQFGGAHVCRSVNSVIIFQPSEIFRK